MEAETVFLFINFFNCYEKKLLENMKPEFDTLILKVVISSLKDKVVSDFTNNKYVPENSAPYVPQKSFTLI